MNEKQIIARAQREVAARQAAAVERRWGAPWRWLFPALALAVLVAFVAVPEPFPRKLLLAMGGVCALRPSHSYFAGSVQLPMESRMTGIYGGFMLTLITLLVLRRIGMRRLGSRLVIGILALFFVSMAFDGVNSTLADIGRSHPYESTNVTRLLTGLLSGIAIAPFLVWLIGVMAAPPTEARTDAVVRAPWELVLPLAVSAGFAALVMSEQAVLYYPIALISIGGVVGVLTIVTLLVVLAVSGLGGRVARLRQIMAPFSLALLITFAVLAGSAAARWTITGGP